MAGAGGLFVCASIENVKNVYMRGCGWGFGAVSVRCTYLSQCKNRNAECGMDGGGGPGRRRRRRGFMNPGIAGEEI